MYSQLGSFNTAWDCGTGNGQIASVLSKNFKLVYATDISPKQLENAPQVENVIYKIQPSEKTAFEKNQFDLITVGQAIHWFNFNEFYREVKRTLKPNGIICILGYGKFYSTKEIDSIVNHFYDNIIGKYWDSERRYIDEKYLTIPFPFKEIICPEIVNSFQWDLNHLIGYISTWSAVKHFKTKTGFNPILELHENLKRVWDTPQKSIHFPMLMRLGKFI
jgi:SAM-dependent methyltransferase